MKVPCPVLAAMCIATVPVLIAAQQTPPPQPSSIEGAAAQVYKTVSGTAHGFFNPGREGNWHAQTLEAMDAFLTRIGYLPPRSSQPQ